MNLRTLWQQTPDLLKRMLHPLLRRYFLVDYVLPEQALVRSCAPYLSDQPGWRSTAIQNVRTLGREERVAIGHPRDDPFIPIGKYYREGYFDRPSIFVCDLAEAALHVGSGMVCTRDMEMVAEFEYRVANCAQFGKRKPRNLKRLAGAYTTVNGSFSPNVSHWMMDCLPRILSLAKAEPKSRVTVLMPASLGDYQRESLACVLPSNFVLEYHPDHVWLRLEKFLWPSMVSGRSNYFLPSEYYEALRRPVFAQFGLPAHHRKTARIYVSRRRARWRRVLNEDAVCALLGRYGFEIALLEDLSFRQQVELFHKAEFVVGPHGAGLVNSVFSGDIHTVVLYPTQTPYNYWHALAKGLGQQHHFVTHIGEDDDNFTVNTRQLENVLQHELGLQPSF